MHSEHYFLSQETADLINETHMRGKRVIGVGTTSCRTVESALDGLQHLTDKQSIAKYKPRSGFCFLPWFDHIA